MVKKMGPAVDYQDLLHQAFDVCYESLNDAVGWNDSEALRAMAMVLDVMGGFEKEARTLISAVFSVVDKSLDTDGQGDGAEGENKTQNDDKNGDGAKKGADGDADTEVDKDTDGSTDGDADEDADEDQDEDAGEDQDEDPGEDQEDKDSASTTSSLPTDEGDLLGDVYFTCNGSCLPNTSLRAWKGRTL
jgi:hypothetical protein